MKARSVTAFIAGTSTGVAAGYLFDPQCGRRRRHVIRDQALAGLRRGSHGAERQARYAAGKAHGLAAEAIPHHRDPGRLNDASLAAKVESELFRAPDAPKGAVDVNVEHGALVLRGQLPDQREIDELLARARAVEGVSEVRSLLRLPGRPAASADQHSHAGHSHPAGDSPSTILAPSAGGWSQAGRGS